MATPRSYFVAPNQRFLPIDSGVAAELMIFDIDESDVWSSASARSMSPEIRTPEPGRIRKNPSDSVSMSGSGRQASLPIKVPDWSKILKGEYMENRRRESDDDDDYETEECGRIPPHEFLARSRIASFSVHEGAGRTLKGRDLSRVRSLVWQKIGFED